MAGLTARVRALAWLRWRLAVNALRGAGGILSAVAGVLLTLLVVLVAALLAACTAAFVLLVGRSGDLGPFGVHLGVFLTLTLLAFLIPFLFGEAKVELAPERFLVFPVRVGELYWIGVGLGFVSGANLVLYPSFLAVAAGSLLIPGVSRPGAILGTAVLLATLVAWQQLLVAAVRVVASHRRSREILAAAGISFMILVGFLPQLAEQQGWFEHHPPVRPEAASGLLHAVAAIAVVLPPVLAARAASSQTLLGVCGPLAGLLLWGAAGLWLGWKAFRWQLRRAGGGQGAARRVRPAKGVRFLDRLPDLLPPPAAGAFRKQVRYLSRSTAGRIVLLTAPVMGVFLSLLLSRVHHEIGGLSVGDLGFLGICFVAGSFIGNFAYNLFMWDGKGASLYLLGPARMWQVLLGLTAAVWVFEAVVLAEMTVAWVVLAGLPPGAVFLTGVLLSAGMTLASTGLGLLASVLFPVPREIGATRNQPALLSGLASLLAMPVVLAILGLAPALLFLAGHSWGAVAAAAGGVAVLGVGYRFAVILAARLLLKRREAFLAALQP